MGVQMDSRGMRGFGGRSRTKWTKGKQDDSARLQPGWSSQLQVICTGPTTHIGNARVHLLLREAQ